MADEILKRDQNFITVLGGITDDSDQEIKMLRVDPITKRLLISADFSGVAVTSINGLTGAVILAAGTNITLTPVGNTITISAAGGSGSPGGSDTQLQYNNAGSFGGITGATTDGTVVTLTSPIVATSLTGSYLTASEMLITDGSKNIVSAAVATYPSLVELTYVKGVTSALQTQLNAKASTALSNLASVAINTTLVSDTDNTDDIGTSSVFWKTGYFKTSIELGATDTTLTRSAAGVLAVEGVVIPSISSTNTLTNKRITKRVVTAADATSITPDTDSADWTYQSNTQATGTLTINNDAGTQTNCQAWGLKIKSTNVQTFSWGTDYVGGTNPLPTSTTGSSQIDYFTFIFDTVDNVWHFTGSAVNL